MAVGCRRAPCATPFRGATALMHPRKMLPTVRAAATTEAGQLSAALDALADLKRRAAPQPEVDAQIESAKDLGRRAGADRIFPDLNDGTFEGLTLSGRMTKMLSGDTPITFQMLSFGLYQPPDLKVRPTGGDAAAVFKGRRFGRENTYVISTPVWLEDAGVEGVSHAVATYHTVAENPQRLEVRFAALRLEPLAGSPEDLQKWLGALAGANPGMDRETGVLEVAIPQGAMPHGWMDYHAMTQDYQLVTGNAGSTTLLRRKSE